MFYPVGQTAPQLEGELKSTLEGVTNLEFDFQNLEYLYLRGDSNAEAPAEVIQDLQRSLPNCEIQY